MAPEIRTEGFVYRRGKRREKEFTPRPEKDTRGRKGQAPGLSTVEELRPGQIGQRIDLARLQAPLRGIADDPAEGGTPGHVAIVPVTDTGEVDQQLLEEWAAARVLGGQHRLTEIVLGAIVEENIEG